MKRIRHFIIAMALLSGGATAMAAPAPDAPTDETIAVLKSVTPADALEICRMILTTPLNNTNNSRTVDTAVATLTQWIGVTDDITLTLSPNITFILETRNATLLGAYIAAMKTLLTYYSRNRRELPTVPLLDSWLTLKGKALDKAIRSQYLQESAGPE